MCPDISFSLYYHNLATQKLAALAQQAASRYDLVFVCDTDIPYEGAWDRSGEANRHIMQKRIICDLILRKIPFFLLRGDLETRVRCVKRILETYRKYENLLAHFAPHD